MPIQQWSDRIWIAQLGDQPALSDDLTQLKQDVMKLDRVPDLLIDMAGVRQINSSNLSQLLRLRKLCIDGDARLRLVAIPDPVWAIFLTTGLDKVFEFAPDVSTALAALQIEKR